MGEARTHARKSKNPTVMWGIIRDDVQKKDYTLELHSDMKTIHENLDTFDFKNGIMRKRKYIKNNLFGCYNYYQRVYHIFIKIIYDLQYDTKRDKQLHYEYLQATSRLLYEMIVQKSCLKKSINDNLIFN